MDGTFVQKLVETTAHPEIADIAGEQRLLAPAGWQEIKRPAPPVPGVLVINTLAGICDYIDANRDLLELKDLLLHVEDYDVVSLVSKLKGDFHQRHHYVKAEAEDLFGGRFTFDQYHDAEAFIVGLQALFVASTQRDELIALVGSIKEESVKETLDNGYAQSVKVAGGVVLVGEKRVPNPVVLSPFRTFREIEQPESPFVLRLQQGSPGQRPKIALFEADGGKWKLEAIKRVSTFLTEKLEAHKGAVAILA